MLSTDRHTDTHTDRHTDRQTGIRSALLGVNNDILRVRGQKNHNRKIKKELLPIRYLRI